MKKILYTALLTIASSYSINLYAETLQDLKFGPQSQEDSYQTNTHTQSSQKGQKLEGIVAMVGNDVITHKELRQAGNSKTALQNLIVKKLLLQEAEKQNIQVSTAELNHFYNKNKKISKQALREQLTIKKLQQQVLMTESLKVSEDKNKIDTSIQQPQKIKNIDIQVQLVDLLIKTPKHITKKALDNQAQLIMQNLQNHTQTASSIAKKYHNVAYNQLGWVSLAKIPPQFSNALKNAPLNQFINPIADNDGIHILKILARKSNNKLNNQTNNTAPRKQADNTAHNNKMAKVWNKWLMELQKNSYIKIIK